MSHAVDRRSLIAAGLGFGAGAVAGAAAANAFLSSPKASAAALDGISATVLADPPASGTEVSVKLDSGAVQRLPYVAPYVPVPGDRVAVSVVAGGPNSSSVVIGGHSGRAGNLVVNGDFHAIPPLMSRQLPYMWAVHRAAGRTTEALAMIHPKLHRPMAVLDNGAKGEQVGDNVLYSAAFPVKPGEVIKADATVSIDLVQPASVAVDLRIGWFADPSAAYPKVLPNGEKVLYARTFDVDGEQLLEGSAAAPVGAAAARVAVRVRHQTGPDGQFTLYLGYVYAGR